MMKIEKVEEIAKEVLLTSGSHRPQIMFDTDKGLEIALMMFENDTQKDLMLLMMRNKVHKERINRYFTIMEGWVGKNIHTRPRDDSEREEALIICEFSRDMNNKMVMQKFTHDESDKIVLGERVFMDKDWESASIWNVFVEDAMEERIKQARKNEGN